MKIALQQVQANIGDIANRHEYSADVIYELLAAYGRSKSAITQLREGHLNKAEDAGAVLQKDVVYFKTFVVGAYLGMSLGGPSCVESDTDNRGSSCVEYADDGYEATGDQKWDKFWSTLPITVIIASLIAVIVRNQMEKDKKK